MRYRRVPGNPVGPRTLGLAAAGGVLIGIGAGALIAAELGVTPWDVLTTAVADLGGVTVGASGAFLSIVVYALCAPFGRLPGWGNAVLLVSVSGAVDATLAVVDEPAGVAGQVLLYVVGVPVVCLGVALIVRGDIGVGPLEMVMLVATDRGVPLVRARVAIEATTLSVGWPLGGALGVGTAGFALAAGPLIATWLRVLARRDPAPPLGAGGEELEAGDGQVAEHGEDARDHEARRQRAPGEAHRTGGQPDQRPHPQQEHRRVRDEQQRQEQVVVECTDDVAVEQVVGPAQATARGAVEAEDEPAGAQGVGAARGRVDEPHVGGDADGRRQAGQA